MAEMSSCGFCGDRWPHTEVHNCWILAKTASQENLPSPVPTDYAQLGRAVETDAEWSTNRG
jgi:hypothetical protein